MLQPSVTSSPRSTPARVGRLARATSLAGLLIFAAKWGASASLPASVQLDLPDFESACEGDNPYFVTACYPSRPGPGGGAESVLMFRDTPADMPHHLLADQAAVGAIWGLAFSPGEPAVYAAAFHKRLVAFGPGGPGAVYRIDLATGDVRVFATVPDAGPDRHDRSMSSTNARDLAGRDWAGKTSLGDIDLDEAGGELFVTNLADRRIYRFALASGQLLGSFAHGAAAEAWAEDARPFGLKVQAGRVYHGVVRTGEISRRRADLSGFVFSSRPDGSDMQRVAQFPLDYARGTLQVPVDICMGNPCWPTNAKLNWNTWRDGYSTQDPNGVWAVFPMPLLADIEFDPLGNLLVGLRDRQGDVTLLPANGHPLSERAGLGVGDLLEGLPEGSGWQVDPLRGRYDDRLQMSSQAALGSLAQSRRRDLLVATSLGEGSGYYRYMPPLPMGGALWFDNASGDKLRQEEICSGDRSRSPGPAVARAHNEGMSVANLGDVEEACGPAPTATPTATETPSLTATPRPSATVQPSATPEATSTAPPSPSPTASPVPPTASPSPAPSYLPLLLREHCDPQRALTDAILVLDSSSSMAGAKIEAARQAGLSFIAALRLPEDHVGLVAFSRGIDLSHPLSGDEAVLEAAVRGIQVSSGTRIDLGLEEARNLLERGARGGDVIPVIVLLTDGIQEALPERPLAIAGDLRAAGVTLYAVGLGADVDSAYLLQLAGDPSRRYLSPRPEDLAAIYAQIARRIPCPPERYWGRRP